MVETNQTENQIKADAINEFVSLMIGAFDSGFVDRNNATLAEIHRVAHHHVKDRYAIELPDIVEQWGQETAEECRENPGTKITLGNELFRFTSEQEWKDMAKKWFSNCSVSKSDYIAIDHIGRACICGSQYKRATKEGAYPIVVYKLTV